MEEQVQDDSCDHLIPREDVWPCCHFWHEFAFPWNEELENTQPEDEDISSKMRSFPRRSDSGSAAPYIIQAAKLFFDFPLNVIHVLGNTVSKVH